MMKTYILLRAIILLLCATISGTSSCEHFLNITQIKSKQARAGVRWDLNVLQLGT